MKLETTPILFSAPGGGLGHLVRTCAVAMHLRRLSIPSRIVTHSVYAEGMRRLTGCDVDFIPARRWRADVADYAARVNPRVIVPDTFPWGIRGEWTAYRGGRVAWVTLARRLKVPAYLQAADLTWRQDAPQLQNVIVSESLGESYEELLRQGGSRLHRLPGRIRLPEVRSALPIPSAWLEMTARAPLWLVVHSGPSIEVKHLLQVAEEGIRNDGGGQAAAVLPRPLAGIASPVWEFFPASRLYDRAHRVITGAGYNSVAEMTLRPEKHLCIPFQRRYDDQAARLRNPFSGSEDGAASAAAFLASLV